jgi:hypothetical protein
MFGTVILVIAAGFVIMIAVIRAQNTPDTQTEPTQQTFTAFNAPLNIFESLRGQSLQQPQIIASSNNTSAPLPNEEEQATLIAQLIRNWEVSGNGSNAQTGSIQGQTNSEVIAREVERQEIRELFNDLIGTKITDSFKVSDGEPYAGPTGSTQNDAVWLGGYTDTQASVSLEPETTALQTELHDYGNAVGSHLQQFIRAQGDQAALLERFLQDRTNTDELETLTNAYVALSAKLSEVTAPNILQSTHAGLVYSYAQVGEYLWRLADAKDDSDLLQKMLAYNKISEAVAKHHVTLVTTFNAHGVEFKSSEPGSIFSFSPPY